MGFKLANKINSSHINWKSNSMKVKLAVPSQTLYNFYPRPQKILKIVMQQ